MVDVTPHPKPTRKPKAKRPGHDAEASLRFKVTVCSEPCLLTVHDPSHRCPDAVQAAHVVSQQSLKRRGLHHLLWDPANGVAICQDSHQAHDLGVRKIPRDWLPVRCIEWAAEHGLLHVLERHWPAAVAS